MRLEGVWFLLANPLLFKTRHMKVRIHQKKRVVALYFKGLKFWDFYRINRTGEASTFYATTGAFNRSFVKAVRMIRNEGTGSCGPENPKKIIPATQWDLINIDLSNFTNRYDAVTHVWKTHLGL